MNRPLSHPIGIGYTAEIFIWEPGWVIKLFRDWVPVSWVEYELKVAQSVSSLGFPAPEAREIVKHGSRSGIVYRHADGPTLIGLMKTKPWKLKWVGREMARLHVEMHSRHGGKELPPQKDRLLYKIRNNEKLPDDLREAALKLMDALEEDDRLCHNDFHPDNILLTKGGSVVIDWMDAARGNPCADVARTIIMMKSGLPPDAGLLEKLMINLFRNIIRKEYIKTYCAKTGRSPEEFSRWIPVAAAARLMENHTSEYEFLMDLIRTGLKVLQKNSGVQT